MIDLQGCDRLKMIATKPRTLPDGEVSDGLDGLRELLAAGWVELDSAGPLADDLTYRFLGRHEDEAEVQTRSLRARTERAEAETKAAKAELEVALARLVALEAQEAEKR